MGKAETNQLEICSSRQALVSINELIEIEKEFPYVNKFQSHFRTIYTDACAQKEDFNSCLYNDSNNIQSILEKHPTAGESVPQSDFLVQDLAWFKNQFKLNDSNFEKAFYALIDSGSRTQIPTKKLFDAILAQSEFEYSIEEYNRAIGTAKRDGLHIRFQDLIKANQNFSVSLEPYTFSIDCSLIDAEYCGWNLQNWLQLTAAETIFSNKENSNLARSDDSADHLKLGKKIEKRIFEERQVLNRIAIQFLQDYLKDPSQENILDSLRFKLEYQKAKISLNQNLNNILTKNL